MPDMRDWDVRETEMKQKMLKEHDAEIRARALEEAAAVVDHVCRNWPRLKAEAKKAILALKEKVT